MSKDKYDPTLLELSETSSEEQEVDVIIGLSRLATDEDLAKLSDRGFKERSVIGDIITGHASTKDMSDIAELDFVLKIEMSRPMHLDESVLGDGHDEIDDFTE